MTPQDIAAIASSIISFFALIVSIVVAWIGLSQLRKLANQVSEAVEQNRINKLNALIGIEHAIRESRLRLSEAGIACLEMKNPMGIDQEKAAALQLQFSEAKQSFLNCLDRLCFAVKKGLLDDDDMRRDYRDMIKEVMRDFAGDFGAATPYRHIKAVYEAWEAK